MNRTTGAERHNNRMNRIFDKYHSIENAKKDLLPTVTEYSYFLDKATDKFKITKDEARTKYGLYTYGQWKELLKLF